MGKGLQIYKRGQNCQHVSDNERDSSAMRLVTIGELIQVFLYKTKVAEYLCRSAVKLSFYIRRALCSQTALLNVAPRMFNVE